MICRAVPVDMAGVIEMSTESSEQPFCQYNNSHWKKVSARNSRKAGYRVSDDSEVYQIEKDRRYIQHEVRSNQSQERRNTRSERTHGQSWKEHNASVGSENDAVFLDDGVQDSASSRINTHSPVFSVVSTDSVNSNTSVIPNPHNRFNHSIYTILMSPCCMVFFLVCCYPGVHFMRKSDRDFNNGDVPSAKSSATRATFFFFFGLAITLSIAGLILFSIIFFTTRS